MMKTPFADGSQLVYRLTSCSGSEKGSFGKGVFSCRDLMPPSRWHAVLVRAPAHDVSHQLTTVSNISICNDKQKLGK